MKYFIDTEFHEYKRSKPYWSKPVDTIELISIGIVSEDGREYYAVSKDFDIKAAWENEWLRKNVLKSIYYQLLGKDINFHELNHFTFGNFQKLIEKNSKSNKQIAEEIKDFTSYRRVESLTVNKTSGEIVETNLSTLSFYGYYSDYDWVVFCWLFGRMIDLPEGFPMYCIDLKQELDRLNTTLGYVVKEGHSYPIQDHPNYPKQTNEHNALADAKWNKELYRFLISLA
jgi:hypothetical protein